MLAWKPASQLIIPLTVSGKAKKRTAQNEDYEENMVPSNIDILLLYPICSK
jgi:hypothetical protein